MRLFIFFISSFVAIAVGKAPLLGTKSKTRIDNEYIVAFHKNSTDETIFKHMKHIHPLIMASNVTSDKIMFEYNMKKFKGYSFHGPTKVLDKILEMDEVDFVEANQIVTINECNDQLDAEWGLVRTTEREKILDGIYSYDSDGEGVDAYVIDTGIYMEHSDFEGRASWGIDTVDIVSPLTDENGHGSHVTGTIIGKTFGLAKKANAVAVRVLNRNGSGTNAGVIEGIEWVENNHVFKMRKSTRSAAAKGSVANMSLGGGFSQALNDAVKSSVSSGVVFVVAAGNDYGADACKSSPASEPSAITVACSNSDDDFCSFSSAGTCVNVIAPGEAITSAWIGSPYATNSISGTSMSSPHVAGVAVKYLSSNAKASPSEVMEWIEKNATPNKINKVPASTTNQLIFMECA